jgi:hypothetical protein
VTQYVVGEHDEARRAWSALAGVVGRIAYPSRELYIRRHALIDELMESGCSLTVQELDGYVPTRFPHEFGPLWQDYSRGFMLPAIELWRDN